MKSVHPTPLSLVALVAASTLASTLSAHVEDAVGIQKILNANG